MQTQLNSFCGSGKAGLILFVFTAQVLLAAPLPIEKSVEWQPFAAQVNRLTEAKDYLGSPFSADEKKAMAALIQESDTKRASEKLQEILDRHCLFGVNINPEMRVKVALGAAKP
ncbi:MAG: hypothetical protein ABIP71_12615, partial [Verrucomicrobiota bacterium]